MLGAQATLPAAVPVDVMVASDRALMGGLYTDAYFYQFVFRTEGSTDDFEGVRAIVRRYHAGLGGLFDALEEVYLAADALTIQHDPRGFDVLRLNAALPLMGAWHIEMKSTFGAWSFTCPIGHVEFTGPSFSEAYRYATASVDGEEADFLPCTVGGRGATGVVIFPRVL